MYDRNDAPKNIPFGIRVREIRKFITQSEFADNVGSRQGNITKIEQGMVPRPELLKKIADFGKVSVEWLLTGDNSKPLASEVEVVIEGYDRAWVQGTHITPSITGEPPTGEKEDAPKKIKGELFWGIFSDVVELSAQMTGARIENEILREMLEKGKTDKLLLAIRKLEGEAQIHKLLLEEEKKASKKLFLLIKEMKSEKKKNN